MSNDWSIMTNDELTVAAFGETDDELPISGFGKMVLSECNPDEVKSPIVITIYMDSKNIQMPFGIVKTDPFLELFWRKTGVDCDGETGSIQLPDGNTYLITLVDNSEYSN